MKKALCLVLCLLLALSTFVACGDNTGNNGTETGASTGSQDTGAHTHIFASDWSNDETNHWHNATCEHTTEKSDLGAHTDANNDDICDVCSYVSDCTHTYDTTKWESDEDSHYHAGTCGHEVRKDEADHVDSADNNGICDVCAYVMCEHTYETGWTDTEGGHWHAPTCGHAVNGTDLTDHVDANTIPDGKCDVCEFVMYHVHTWGSQWQANAEKHWHAATCTGHEDVKKDEAAHADTDKNGNCDVCGYIVCSHTYANVLSSDENYHFYAVTCGCNVPPKNQMGHVDANDDKYCDVCNRQVDHIHSYSTEWTKNDTAHWHACNCSANDVTCNGDVSTLKDSYALHSYASPTSPGYCTVCDYANFYTATITGSDLITPGTPVDVMKGTAITIDTQFTFSAPVSVIIDGFRIGETNYAYGDLVASEDKSNNIITYYITLPAGNADVEVVVRAHSLSNVELIKTNGKVDLNAESANMYATGTIEINLPSAGKYIVYSPSHDSMNFSIDNNKLDKNGISGIFEVTKAGNVTIDCTYFTFAAGEIEATYVVAKIQTSNELPELSGSEIILPTNANITLNFEVPSAGLWQFSSSVNNITINEDVTNPQIFHVAEGELNCSIVVHNQSTEDAIFELDWEITKVSSDATVVELGTSEEMTFTTGNYVTLTFTPDLSGVYTFNMPYDPYSVYLYYWNTDYEYLACSYGTEFETENLVAGTTYTYYLTAIEAESPVNGTVEIVYNGYNAEVKVDTDDQNLYQGNFLIGSPNSIMMSGTYEVSAQNGAEFSVDNGENWLTTGMINFDDINRIVVRNETDSDAEFVNITFRSYTVVMNAGNPDGNSFWMIPNKYYTVSLYGSCNPSAPSYTLEWTDANVTVTASTGAVTSGDTIDETTLTIVYTGDTAAKIDFTLTDVAIHPVLKKLDGVYHTEDGEYTVTFTPDSLGATTGTMIIAGKTSTTLDGEYTYTFINDQEFISIEIKKEDVIPEEYYIQYVDYDYRSGISDFLDLTISSQNNRWINNRLIKEDANRDLLTGMWITEANEYIVTITPNYVGAYNGMINIIDNLGVGTENLSGDYEYVFDPETNSISTEKFTIAIAQRMGRTMVFFSTPDLFMPLTLKTVMQYDEVAVGTPVDIDVQDPYSIYLIAFTATEAGEYSFFFGTGETNGAIIYDDGSSASTYNTNTGALVLTMTANQTVLLKVSTANWQPDTITVLVSSVTA